MKFKLLTIFPDMLKSVLSESILGRAIQSGAIQAEVIDIRPFSMNKHKNTDDAPYGGGAGMVMLAQSAVDAIKYAMGEHFRGKRIYLSPKGEPFTQATAERLSKEEELILFCGHYEGLDQRVIDGWIDEEISVGDYVLTGGELGALIITDAVSRLLPGVLGSDESSVDESFSSGLLEYPQYTRPREFEGRAVPEVLLNGDQKLIDRWRRDEALSVTLERRPELLEKTPLNGRDREFIRSVKPRMSLGVSMRAKDEALIRQVKSRLYEAAHGLIRFEEGENILLLDGDMPLPEEGKRIFLPRLTTQEEVKRATMRGAELFGITPLAFDYSVQELFGDDSIDTLVFSGMSREEYASLSALWLPIRKMDEKAIYFAKSRRALYKKGYFPRVEVHTRGGESYVINPDPLPTGWLKAAMAFFKTGRAPMDEETMKNVAGAYRALL
ncbi:MAG: tRNA (guanosine(37)-N1)-methyltransferase TrmD [Clostridia bacterium]|nr:tRNA (guanosine(37)-N1)-methyltransferase TrmD [Clostridia bacterium]